MTPENIITLSRSQDVPFERLVLSERNVRRIRTGQSIEELAEDIAQRTLLQSLSVRPLPEREGYYEVQAGGRRYRALEMLVKQGRLAVGTPIPCIVREDGLLEEDSLAENVQRRNLHPLDQFRAFQSLRDRGLGEEEIAARFFVTPHIVRQRLKLAGVSPKLLEAYETDEMTLEQLMALTVTDDHARQEQVWETASQSYSQHPGTIRRLLTENSVAADDPRALFVGLDAYEAAGGVVQRDLFSKGNDGWIEDPALLERLFTEKLARAAEAVSAEGWKWVEVAESFPYGHTRGLQRIPGEETPMSAEETAEYEALDAERDEIEQRYFQEDSEDMPDEVRQRFIRLNGRIDELEDRPVIYDPAAIARAGTFVSLDDDGTLIVERGFIGKAEDDEASPDESTRPASPETAESPAEPEEEEGMKPLSDRLMMELTAHRTLALRDALGSDPDMAFLAVLHTLALQRFYHFSFESCLEIAATSSGFSVQGPDLKSCASARSIEDRHEAWRKQLPGEPEELWDTLRTFDEARRKALFAHCAGLSVNAVRGAAGRMRHADQLAMLLALDLHAAGWRPTAANYLGRVSKAHILEAITEAKGESSAALIEHMRKTDMAAQAERMLDGTNWLPEPLRTPCPDPVDEHPVEEPDAPPEDQESADLPAFLCDAA